MPKSKKKTHLGTKKKLFTCNNLVKEAQLHVSIITSNNYRNKIILAALNMGRQSILLKRIIFQAKILSA